MLLNHLRTKIVNSFIKKFGIRYVIFGIVIKLQAGRHAVQLLEGRSGFSIPETSKNILRPTQPPSHSMDYSRPFPQR